MHRTLSRFKTAALVVATATLGAAVVPSAAGAAQPAPQREVAFFAPAPMGATGLTPLASLPSEVQDIVRGTGVAHIETATERGYKLRRGTRVNDYVYNSGNVYAIDASCGVSGCRPVSQVQLSMKENVFGRTSKRWTQTLNARTWSGNLGWSLSYTYNCGVNIPHATDSTCSSWRSDGADGGTSGVINPGATLNHGFGSTNNVTKFPMVKFQIAWSDGTVAIGDDGARGEKFRGWDVCVRARSTKLCPTTGDGS